MEATVTVHSSETERNLLHLLGLLNYLHCIKLRHHAIHELWRWYYRRLVSVKI